MGYLHCNYYVLVVGQMFHLSTPSFRPTNPTHSKNRINEESSMWIICDTYNVI